MEPTWCGVVAGTAGESAVFSSKPFFAAGTVETDVDKSLREAEQGDHQAASAVSTDAVMREVQEEHNFLRLLHRMRGELQISDRVYDRVPHFQVHLPFLAGYVSSDNECESHGFGRETRGSPVTLGLGMRGRANAILCWS
jgi:hypothetical protein